LANEFFLD